MSKSNKIVKYACSFVIVGVVVALSFLLGPAIASPFMIIGAVAVGKINMPSGDTEQVTQTKEQETAQHTRVPYYAGQKQEEQIRQENSGIEQECEKVIIKADSIESNETFVTVKNNEYKRKI